MSPSPRQIFIWSLPTLFLLSFLWYKRKKSALQSDPGGTAEAKSKRVGLNRTSARASVKKYVVGIQKKSVVSELGEENFESRSVSGVDSSPNDTVCLAEELSCLVTEETPSTLLQPVETVGDISTKAEDFKEVETVVKSTEVQDFEEVETVVKSTKAEDFQEPPTLPVQIAASAVSADLQHVDKINEEVLVKEEVFLETSVPIVSSTPTAEVHLPLASQEEDSLSKVNQETVPETEEKLVHVEFEINNSSEESNRREIINRSVVGESWAAECESEVECENPADETIVAEAVESVSPKEGEMARELSSEVSLKGDSPVEETVTTRHESVDESSLERKLSSLGLDDAGGKQLPMAAKALAAKETNGERDSANHSPSEVMLGSPSMSNYSDAQSEGSSDSGKGCSDVATPPSRTPVSGSSVAGDAPATSVYEFVLPQLLVGRLIGRHGLFVHQIKTKTHASILIKRHPETHKLKICAIEGSQLDIENALEMIRGKFPVKRYPNVSLEQVSFVNAATVYPPVPDSFQLQLIEGVNNDVILSSLVTPGHFFLQQPTHPTYPSLNRLNVCMNFCYNECTAPALPSPIEAFVICVAPTMGGWYRAQVVSSDAESSSSDVKFIDYGGYQTVDNAQLRQIRSDFIALPFQAAECYLANVKPKDGVWPYEAFAFVEELTHGQVLQAQIYGYANDGVPVVFLYSIQGAQVVVVNRELVDRGYAEWDEPTEEPEAAGAEAAAEAVAISA